MPDPRWEKVCACVRRIPDPRVPDPASQDDSGETYEFVLELKYNSLVLGSRILASVEEIQEAPEIYGLVLNQMVARMDFALALAEQKAGLND